MKHPFSKVLITDAGGTPKQWASHQDAILYKVKNLVVWTPPGATKAVFYGGTCAASGKESSVEVESIMAVSGPMAAKISSSRDNTPRVSGKALFERDHNRCAYCGEYFDSHHLTKDHIIPKKDGGRNTWMNLITACKSCNGRKADRTPEKAGMRLRYQPYVPSRIEYMWFGNSSMTTDQIEYMELFKSKKNK